jgi:hypothetical protein
MDRLNMTENFMKQVSSAKNYHKRTKKGINPFSIIFILLLVAVALVMLRII